MCENFTGEQFMIYEKLSYCPWVYDGKVHPALERETEVKL